MQMVTGSEGTNKCSHICPYLEIRTRPAGGVLDYVDTRCSSTMCPPEGDNCRDPKPNLTTSPE